MAAAWHVIQKGFSAVTIGIGFQNDQIGWTSHTDGSSAPKIVKTHDGGATWDQVQNVSGVAVLTTSFAAQKGNAINVATTGALESSVWSLDGERFVQSLGAPLVAQDIKHQAGHLTIGGTNGPCIASLGGGLYKCHKVPFNVSGTGRYASRPTGGDVIYMAAGQWPDSSVEREVMVGEEKHFKLSRHVRIVDGKRMEFAPESNADPVTDYSAELWKSTDGGETWKNLLSDFGRFYFNDIHCIDDTHCIAVAEGFGESGGETGAHIFRTVDGETFERVHTENTTGKESLMTVRMLSQTEYWAGGATSAGGLFAPALILHSTDGGASHSQEGAGIKGQMLTSMDFLDAGHGYATSITGMQICDLLEFGGNNPPAPTPAPVPGAPHYEKPPCQEGEAKASVTDTDGSLCAPPCDASGNCPTDVPEGVSANPSCVLKDTSGNQFCALMCQSDDDCGGAKCEHPQAGAPGLCVYPDSSNTKPFVFVPPQTITV